MGWEIAKIVLMNRGDSALKADVSIRTSWGYINGFKILKKNDRIWVNPPQIPFKTQDGETKYKTIVKFNEDGKGGEIWEKLSSDILKKYKEEIGSSRGRESDYDDDRPKKKRYDDDDEPPKAKRDHGGIGDDEDYVPKKKKKYSDDNEIDIDSDY